MPFILSKNITSVGPGAPIGNPMRPKTYQASGLTTAGTGSATIAVQGQNEPSSGWDTIGTITLTLGTTVTSDSFTSDDRYELLRGNVTAIAGTGATVSLTAGA